MKRQQECTFCGERIKQSPKQKEAKQTPSTVWRQKLIEDDLLPAFHLCEKCKAEPGRIVNSSGKELGQRIRKTVNVASPPHLKSHS